MLITPFDNQVISIYLFIKKTYQYENHFFEIFKYYGTTRLYFYIK